MQLLIFTFSSLILDILTDDIFRCMFTHRRDKKTVRPELPSPKLFFDRRSLREYFSGSYTLHLCHDLRRAVSWNRLDQKVNVVTLCSNFQKSDFITLGYFKTNIFQQLIDFFGDYKPSILGDEHEMIHQQRDIMIFSNKLTHEPIRNAFLKPPQAAGY
jgi:hypothetical protein